PAAPPPTIAAPLPAPAPTELPGPYPTRSRASLDGPGGALWSTTSGSAALGPSPVYPGPPPAYASPLAARPAPPPKATSGGRRGLLTAAGLAVLAVGAGLAIAVATERRGDEPVEEAVAV